MEDKLYYQILDTMLVLRDTADLYKTYSANDIKSLIAAKLKAKKKEPKDLQSLYNLETMIRTIRESFIVAKNETNTDNNNII